MHRNNVLYDTDVINTVRVKEHLIEVVFLEHLQGLDNLPHAYASNFFISLNTLLKKSITKVKQCFLVIRFGRESIDLDSYTDIYTTDVNLRLWTGLTPIQ